MEFPLDLYEKIQSTPTPETMAQLAESIRELALLIRSLSDNNYEKQNVFFACFLGELSTSLMFTSHNYYKKIDFLKEHLALPPNPAPPKKDA